MKAFREKVRLMTFREKARLITPQELAQVRSEAEQYKAEEPEVRWQTKLYCFCFHFFRTTHRWLVLRWLLWVSLPIVERKVEFDV